MINEELPFDVVEEDSIETKIQKTRVTIYTDGSCNPNPGKGGWSAILLFTDENGVEYKREIYGYS